MYYFLIIYIYMYISINIHVLKCISYSEEGESGYGCSLSDVRGYTLTDLLPHMSEGSEIIQSNGLAVNRSRRFLILGIFQIVGNGHGLNISGHI